MLHTNNTAEFILTSTGGSLTLTGSLGQVFQLEFPSNAVVSDVLVRMTEIPAFAGLPFTGQYCGGVELRPSGLAFFNPGKLTITTPGRIPRGFTSFATGPAGSDLHLYPAWPVASNAVVFPILHFTDYGGAEAQPGEAEAQAQKDPCKKPNKWQQAIAAILRTYYDAFFGSDQPPAKQYPDRNELWPPLKEWFNQSVWPNLKAAETDVAALDEAVSDFGTWARELELLDVFDSTQWQQLIDNGATGLTPDQKALLEAGLLRKKCFPVLTKAFANAIVKTHVRAIEENNPWIIPNVVGYAKAAQLWGVPADLLPDFFSLEAALDRVARVFRFDLEIQSHIQITVPKGTDSEQIRSGRAPIELDFSSAAAVPMSLNTLIKRFSTNIDLVSLDLKVDGTWRPVLQTGKLKFSWLKLIPEYDEPANPNACPPPKPSEKPKNVRVYCAYKVTDPVPTMEVYSQVMGWISAPADMWGSAYPLLHDDELINIIDPYNPDGDPLESVMPKPDQWNYLGGQIVARATYDRTKPAKGGQATETTELLLRFAPKQLRPKDTQIPDLSK